MHAISFYPQQHSQVPIVFSGKVKHPLDSCDKTWFTTEMSITNYLY